MVGCAAGALTENDQDIYRFSVSPEQAGQAFILVLDGVPDALTKAELLRARGADRPQTLYTLASPHGDEVQSDALILSAGDYLRRRLRLRGRRLPGEAGTRRRAAARRRSET